ncbi:MAG: hypothetical protein NAOJABEB_00386 [Steroidobacteraceae bacterium]|nr:hypothetical protein [Steroidobacteraceae bacterium]
MSGIESPWIALPVALLLVAGGLLALVGSLGLVRLRSFQARMHGPSMGNTLGLGCLVIATIVVGSAVAQRPVLHALLITVFVVMTSPVTAMLLMRASIHRERARARSAEDEVIQR